MTDLETASQAVRHLIATADHKISPAEITKSLTRQSGFSGNLIRKALKVLISKGELRYCSHFGSTWIEPSFLRPVRISRSIVVKPQNMGYRAEPQDIVMDLAPGISFGAGDHPTTRLSVQGIEHALRDRKLIPDFNGTRILDIGTGSGILAIAALKCGIAQGIGTDTDPCALSEARQNARLNGLEKRLRILPAEDPIAGMFSMITANLRLPDIMRLFPLVSAHAIPGAPVVLSGLRPFEVTQVLSWYTEKEFQCLDTSEEKNWSCLVLLKKA